MNGIHLKPNQKDITNLEKVKKKFGIVSTAEAVRLSLQLTAGEMA